MVTLTEQQVVAALARHASSSGEVYPSALGLIDAEEHWSGRLREVLGVVMVDQETMRYLAGGNRPEEVAACAVRWAESSLAVEDIKAVVGNGGYDPEPFEVIAREGLLQEVLHLPDGSGRRIDGERAGTWISVQLALESDDVVLRRAKEIAGPDMTAS